jgi:hypothetical protein
VVLVEKWLILVVFGGITFLKNFKKYKESNQYLSIEKRRYL